LQPQTPQPHSRDADVSLASMPNDFTDLAEVEQRLLGFQDRYEQAAEPSDWALHPFGPGPTPAPPGRNRAAHQGRMTTLHDLAIRQYLASALW
jgi:hypothetical protein